MTARKYPYRITAEFTVKAEDMTCAKTAAEQAIKGLKVLEVSPA